MLFVGETFSCLICQQHLLSASRVWNTDEMPEYRRVPRSDVLSIAKMFEIRLDLFLTPLLFNKLNTF